jgi:hypothetical protein
MTTTSMGEQMAPEFRPIENRTGAAIAKYLCVKMVPAEAPDSVVVTAADTDIPHAITCKELPAISGGVPGVGDGVLRGRTRVTASAAITAGDRIAPEANGKVKTAVAADIVIGRALETCTTDGDIIMAEVDLVAPVLF